jgi:hypothetical protein
MIKNKLNFLLLISLFSSNLQSSEVTKGHKTVGRKLCGSFNLELERNGNNGPLLPHHLRIKLVPGEGFSGFGSDTIEGFSGLSIGSKKVFFKLPDHNPISLAAFLSLFNTTEESPLCQEKLTTATAIITLFFKGKTTEKMTECLTFKKAYEVSLKDDSQALVLIPEDENITNA